MRSPALLLASLVCLATSAEAAGQRALLLVPLAAEPSWQDFAYLAAVPAATVVTDGAPAVVALEPGGAITPEVADYVRRYRPSTTWAVGGSVQAVARPLAGSSLSDVAGLLSRTFWQSAATAVVCAEDDYEAALVASALAARLRAPLLFAGRQGLARDTVGELRRLRVREVVAVGAANVEPGLPVVRLADARAVVAWAKARRWGVTYLAAVNPADRQHAVIRRLSLSGALLAAGRGGLVVPLTYETRWKSPFVSQPAVGELPAGLPRSAAPAKSGRISFDGHEYAYYLTGEANERNLRLSVQVDRAWSSPLASGDTIELGGRRYAVSLGTRTGPGKSDVHLTWPTAEQLGGDLRGYYDALGSAPEHLCLVGFPDAIPQAIIGHGGVVEEQTSDLPFANADADDFAEIGVSRVIAENASYGTLYASRVLTYSALLAPEWQDRACQSRWENTYARLFENVGFDAGYRHTSDDLKWIKAPADGKPGQRALTFDQGSPLASCAALAHTDHSWWHELGHTFGWDAQVLLAPVVVESGGCLTCSMDRETDYRSVVARLFRCGAVAFAGNGREGCAPSELQRIEFWNGMLAGQTLGQAHRRSINSARVAILDRREDAGGIYRYQAQIRTQFGDPAFAMRLPAKPKSAPARVTVRGDQITVHAPEQWWPTKIVVPEDWKKWADRDLYVVRGAGTYARRQWCDEGYDREETWFTAEFTTNRRAKRIEQVQTPTKPLGWTGQWYVDEHADGRRTYRWAVRLIDFDQIGGKIVSAVDQVDYRVTYE
ncbi:MAG: hypothetical protein HZB16_19155 [Armatimonadetes bacterium]|nr:hypothetical protein [Armatimonadota bacterium]